jgi:beta-glucosidase
VIAWFSHSTPTRLKQPKKQICGFAKSRPLLPGELQEVKIVLDFHGFGMYEARRGCWAIDKNSRFEILLGTSSNNAVPAWRVKALREIAWVK